MTSSEAEGLRREAAKVLAGSGIDFGEAARLASGGPAHRLGGRKAALAATLRDGWQTSELAEEGSGRLAPGSHPGMGAAVFELGQRLRAAHTGRPAPRLIHTPFFAGGPLVGVTAVHVGARTRVSVQRPGSVPVTGLDGDALPALLPSSGREGHETLVVADRRTLERLVGLARSAQPGTPVHAAGALLDWWSQRSQHPGSGAVLILSEACSARWVIGGGPQAERSVGAWARWLGVTGTGTEAVLAIARCLVGGVWRVVAGAGEEDRLAWTWLLTSTRDWRLPDSPRAAAIGLVSRNAAAALWARSLLEDAAWAARERHLGRVVIGAVATPPAPDGRLSVVTADGLCRHRPGDMLDLDLDESALHLRAELDHLSVRRDGGLTLGLAPVGGHRKTAVEHVRRGHTAVVRPPWVNPSLHAVTRRAIAAAYGPDGSWATSRSVAAPRIRRDVPLGVVIAGSA